MNPNISSVLFLCAVCIWTTYCETARHYGGHYMTSDTVQKKWDQLDLINLLVLRNQGGLKYSSWNKSGNGVNILKIPRFVNWRNDIDKKVVNFLDTVLAREILTHPTRGAEGEFFLPKSDREEYDNSISTNKDLATRPRQKSIEPEQFATTSGHENGKDLTFAYKRDSRERDTYRASYHQIRAKNGSKRYKHPSVSVKSFEGLSDHYKTRGAGEGERRVQKNRDNFYNKHPEVHKLVSLSRVKRGEREGVSRPSTEHRYKSVPENSTRSTSHSDHNSWPDNTARLTDKITSPALVSRNVIVPVVDPVRDVPKSTPSPVQPTTASVQTGMQGSNTSSLTSSTTTGVPSTKVPSFPLYDSTKTVSAATASAPVVAPVSAAESADSTTKVSGVPTPLLENTPEPVPETTPQSETSTASSTSPEPTTEALPEPTTEALLEPTTEALPETKNEVLPEPTTEVLPEPRTEISPEPTTEVSPEPTTEVSPEPRTEISPEPTTEVSPEPTTELLPEPTTEVSPEPTTRLLLKPPTGILPDSTSEPTTKILSKPTTKPLPERTTETSLESTTKALAEPKAETSAEPITESTPEPSTVPEPRTDPSPPQTTSLVRQHTAQSSAHSAEPETTAEPLKDVKTFSPIELRPEADKGVTDEITKITNSLSSLNSTSTSKNESTTAKSTPETGVSDLPEPGASPTNTLPTDLSEPRPSSEPDPSSTSEPKPEPSTPEPSTAEPEVTPEAPAESTPIAIAEPGPDWEKAKKMWSIAWDVHLYMFGGIYTAIAFYSVTSMIKLYQINRLLSKKYFITLNLLIFMLCTVRAVFLIVDGYNSNRTFHPVLNYLLYSTAFPCLTSSFSILLYALLQATKMRLVPPRVQKIQILMVVIFLHFALQMTTDILVGTYAGMSIMLFVCQLVFICWGLFLFVGYAYIFRHLYSSAVKRQKNYQYMLTGKQYPSGGESYKHKFTLSLAVKVTFMAAIFGLVTVALEIYAIVGVYGVFSDKKPEPWPWWMYHTALRLVECLMCITMAYVASQPFRYREVETCGFMCAPCLEMCKCGAKNDQSDKLGWSEYDRLYMTTNKRTNGHTNGKKKKIYLNEGTDIVPIVIQPSTTEESRPPSMLIIEDGYVRFQAETDINKIVDNYSKAHGETEMSALKNSDGIINCAYIRSMEDTVRFQDDVTSSDGLTRKSRKSSLASSGFFRPPSSISLADSMESEIEKAFRSMREDGSCRMHASSHSLPSQSTHSVEDLCQGPAVQAYLEQVPNRPGANLRRSRSALADLNIHRTNSWSKKLFRSRSDSTDGVRTKDIDSMRYLSLLDLEKQQEKNVTFSSETSMLKDSDNSDDSFIDNHQSTDTMTANRDVVTKLLHKQISEPEEIDV